MSSRIEIRDGVTINFTTPANGYRYTAVVSGPIYYVPTPFGSPEPFSFIAPVHADSVAGVGREHDGIIHTVRVQDITAVRDA